MFSHGPAAPGRERGYLRQEMALAARTCRGAKVIQDFVPKAAGWLRTRLACSQICAPSAPLLPLCGIIPFVPAFLAGAAVRARIWEQASRVRWLQRQSRSTFG